MSIIRSLPRLTLLLTLLPMLLLTDAQAAAPPARRTGIVQQIVTLTARDGQSVPGILMYPSAGPDPYSPGVVLLHGGPFGHPIRTQSAARFVAERLAARGYTTLSILSRHAAGYYSIPVEAGSADIAAAVDWLSGLGIRNVVLAGHSFGSARVALYEAETQDPRVKAMVHYAPTRGSSEYLPQAFPEGRYAAEVERLRHLVAQGRGDEPTLIEIPFPPPAPPGAKFAYIMTAANWLAWWGPDARAQNLRLMPRLAVPMLMITGDHDMFVTRDYQERLAQAATSSPGVERLIYEGTGHELSGAEDRAAADTAHWLTGIGLGVMPRVRTRLVDVRVGAKAAPLATLQAGIVYEPAIVPKSESPAVMLLYDRGQDVLTNPSEWLAPALAQRAHRVLVPQDSSFGPNVDRIGETATDADLQTWIDWLTERGRHPVVLAGRGWGGERAARFLLRHPQPMVRGLVLLNPPPDGAAWARRELGDADYEAAVARATTAVADGKGAATLIGARGTTTPTQKSGTGYRFHLLANAFLAQYGPQREPLAAVLASVTQPVFLVRGDADDSLSVAEFTALASAAGARVTAYAPNAAGTADRAENSLADAVAHWLRRVSNSAGRCATPMMCERR